MRVIGVGLVVACLTSAVLAAQTPVVRSAAYIPYAEALPILRTLRDDRLPSELRGQTPAEREAAWPDFVARRDAATRARLDDADADAIIYLLQFGTTFTKQPRIGERQLAGVVMRQAGGGASRFVPSPLLLARIEDFASAVASPGTNTRMRFARQVIERRGIDPATDGGRRALRQYLQARVETVGPAERLSRLLNPEGDAVDQMTLFRDRGLASDTSILIGFGVEAALADLKTAGLLPPRAVRRVAIVGPGLDFIDKQEGYDFYPEQTIQPFAVVDSLIRLGLASAGDFQVVAFDLSPRVLHHLDEARRQARDGHAYTVVVPRSLDQPWTPDLARFWEHFGDRIGDEARGAAPPAAAGRLDVKRVAIRPAAVLPVVPQDLNVVLQRVEPLSADDGFDLILATNVLIYYDVFEQSLAVANVAKMLRPGGVFLTNDRIADLPGSPLAPAGQTTVVYLKSPATGEKGDRLAWYRRR